jgi:predicted nucleic acid-binding Zn ribbon protein
MITKCTECGNTFKIDTPKADDVVTCPTCEANYKTTIEDGKIRLSEYVYEGEDPGEL